MICHNSGACEGGMQVAYEQLDIFSLMPKQENKKAFNPVEEFAKRGSGFAGGKRRIADFFSKTSSLGEMAEFLKQEYGIGGFAFPCDEPFVICRGDSRSTGCLCEYYDEKMEVKKIAISYKELAKNIALMIEEGRY